MVTTASLGGGELFAAWQASGAPVGDRRLGPANPAIRAALPAIGRVLRLPGMAGFATRRLARITTTTAKERPRRSSWGRARVEWPSGRVREGWLRTGEGMTFTVGAVTEVALAAGAEFVPPTRITAVAIVAKALTSFSSPCTRRFAAPRRRSHRGWTLSVPFSVDGNGQAA